MNNTETTPPPEILLVPADMRRVSCNGGGGALGHPKVWYSFEGQEAVTCGYCDRLFTKAERKGAKPYQDAA